MHSPWGRSQERLLRGSNGQMRTRAGALSSGRATASGCSGEVGCLFFLWFGDTEVGVTLVITTLS